MSRITAERPEASQIFVSNETHMAGWWSPLVMNRVLTFFNRVMPTSTALSASSYTYTIWNIFKIIALSGLLLFAGSLWSGWSTPSRHSSVPTMASRTFAQLR